MTGTHNEGHGTVHGSMVQAGSIGQITLTTPRPEALAGLPPAAAEFTGREAEIRTLLDALGPDSGGQVITVAGLAGIGKTTLAVRAAHRALTEGWFPGGVLFIDLRGYDGRGPVRVEDALGAFAAALGVLSEHIPRELAGRETLYRTLLHERPPTLVMLDNAAAASQVRPLLPNSSGHRVLITGRQLLADLAGARLVELDVLRPAESVALLESTLTAAHPGDARITEQSDAAAELAELCGHLPLALSVVAALLASDQQQPIAELVADLRDNTTRLDELRFGDTLAVQAAFDLSYLRLDASGARMFRLLSLHPGRQLSSASAAALAGIPERRARRLLDTLRQAHMLLPGNNWGWYRFHDLLRLYAADRAKIEDDENSLEEAFTRLLDYYLETATAAQNRLQPESYISSAMTRFADPAEALSWLDSERTSLVGVVLDAHRKGRYEDVRDLALVLTNFFDLRTHVDDWVTTHELAVDAARRLGERGNESVLLRRLGNALRHLRDYDGALHHYSQSLEIAREIGNRQMEATSLTSVAAVHRHLGELERALEECTSALALHRDLGDLGRAAVTLTNLAAICRQQQDFEGALKHDVQALRLRREIGDARGQAQSLNNLGNTLRARGSMAPAVSRYEQALNLHREIGDRYGEAQTLFNLGLARAGSPTVRSYWVRQYWEKSIELFLACGDEREARAVRTQLDTLRVAPSRPYESEWSGPNPPQQGR